MANTIQKICPVCENEFESKLNSREKTFCSRYCARLQNRRNAGKKGGLRSAEVQARRSKNEILFAELCTEYFKSVLTNQRLFEGWDADVIIEDLKIAVLWDGPWHRKQITAKHSLSQVQTRDRLKREAIIRCGYKYYTIEDNGKFNKEFVQNKFDEFIDYSGIEKRSNLLGS